ncbi:MAG: methyltransferase domain-containing protein [Symploca sp. SIO1C2]|nr:methyltransferase domain-containing protein [Symploca sp. SIO1C2]
MTTETIPTKPELLRLQKVVDKLLTNPRKLRVLEAGCGSATEINLPQDAHFVGVDISAKQLERNAVAQEKILGDIQTYPLPAGEFDVILCFYLLEHLPQPELALKNFVQTVKEDGIIILALPNVLSIWGLITKFTPHWFHVWVYRYIFGEKRAGTDDFGPFQTFSRLSISPKELEQFALNHNLSIEYLDLYENFRQTGMREKYGLWWQLLAGTVKVLSFGQVATDNTDYILVLKKQKGN